MKIFFWGETRGDCGPTIVNKTITKNLSSKFFYVKSVNKYMRGLEGAWKIARSDVVVVSGVSKGSCVFVGIAHLLGKKAAYIMHGCAVYEGEINQIKTPEQGRKQEQYLLENADLLLPVSKKFMYWVQERYPQYAKKTKYLHNGIDKELLPQGVRAPKISNSIIAAGGDRKQKANDVLADVVESMEGQANLEIFGGLRKPIAPDCYKNVKYKGKVSHNAFVLKMAQSKLLVLNSIFEPFSLAVVEALMCGCSVLVSEHAGVTDILELEETDVIHDPMNTEEIKEKIVYLLEHPNNQRIRSKLDVEQYSGEKQVERLEKLCRELIGESV